MGGGGTRKRIPIDLRRILFEQDSAGNIDMVNFDIVVVPAFNTLVYVEGEVTKPGPFPFYPNLRASDYIGQAGGPTIYANVRSQCPCCGRASGSRVAPTRSWSRATSCDAARSE